MQEASAGESRSPVADGAPVVPQDPAHLVDGRYGIADLVDLDQLRDLFDKFNRATGFTIGFLDHPGLNVLIATAWRPLCTHFHRSCAESAAVCIQSNRHLLDALDQPGQIVVEPCENGLVDCATPIIIKGKHIASLATGQLLVAPPDRDWFRAQARRFGFDEQEYLRALDEIPVFSEEKVRAVTAFLGQMAHFISQLGYTRLEELELKERAAAAIRESEAKYRALIETTDTGFVIVDRNGCVLDANAEYVRLTGRDSLAAIRGHNVLEWTASQDVERNRAEVAVCMERGFVRNLVVDYITPSGLPIPVEINATALRSATEGDRILSICRDITGRKQMEERLRQSEKMNAVGQLAGGIAHDFNNQLVGILGYADLLAESLDDPVFCRYARSICASAQRAADLTHQLLAFARKGKYLSVPVDLHKIIGETAGMLGRSIDKRIAIRLHLDAPSAAVMGDPTLLQNALLNLGLNARDAMPNGGELVFATRILDADGAASGEDLPSGRYLQVSVTDTGVGMTAETRRRLFEPFFTTKKAGEGTGLGLASVYGAVRSHAGAIRVYSEPGRGSAFHLYLPLPAEAGYQVPASESSAAREMGHRRILVVDDETAVLDAVGDMLRGLGCEVTTCNDPGEALAGYRRTWRDIDLVILDMIMPKMGGRELFLAMKEINPAIRAVLSSGFSINGEAQEICKLGVLAFVQKPFRRAELVRTLADAVGGSVSPAAGADAQR